MLSVSRSRGIDARAHTRFTPVFPRTPAELAEIILEKVWSPVVFQKDAPRSKAGFQKAHLVSLDFDSGAFTLDMALDFVKQWELSHVIGTTKSHQKVKVSPSGRVEQAHDRFRMVLVASSWCTDREVYEWNMGEVVEMLGADKSCVDGARFFWPCADIVSFSPGEKWRWRPLPSDHLNLAARRALAKARARPYIQTSSIPPWLQRILLCQERIPEGKRHPKTFDLARRLAIHGWDEDRIYQALMRTNLSDLGEYDVRRTVRAGFQAGRG